MRNKNNNKLITPILFLLYKIKYFNKKSLLRKLNHLLRRDIQFFLKSLLYIAENLLTCNFLCWTKEFKMNIFFRYIKCFQVTIDILHESFWTTEVKVSIITWMYGDKPFLVNITYFILCSFILLLRFIINSLRL